jgi:hypothetical protein
MKIYNKKTKEIKNMCDFSGIYETTMPNKLIKILRASQLIVNYIFTDYIGVDHRMSMSPTVYLPIYDIDKAIEYLKYKVNVEFIKSEN